MPSSSEPVLHDVLAERARQDERYGPVQSRPHGLGVWLAVLMEEVGEVARAHLEAMNPDGTKRIPTPEQVGRIREELVQVAAVAVAVVQWLDARGGRGA